MAESNEKNESIPPSSGASSTETAAPEGATGAESQGTGEAADPLAEARAEAAKMKDQWIRTAADFDNFRKRARRELEDVRKAGKEDLLKEFLPVFDNLERAMQSAQRATEVKPVADGLTMILKQFLDTVGRAGIVKVPTKGAPFDPTVHEAIQQVESEEEPGTVVAEVQAGYLHGDRLVRAAMVVVAKPKAKEEREPASDSAAGDEGKADAVKSDEAKSDAAEPKDEKKTEGAS